MLIYGCPFPYVQRVMSSDMYLPVVGLLCLGFVWYLGRADQAPTQHDNVPPVAEKANTYRALHRNLSAAVIAACWKSRHAFATGCATESQLLDRVAMDTPFISPWAYMEWLRGGRRTGVVQSALSQVLEHSGDVWVLLNRSPNDSSSTLAKVFPTLPNPVELLLQEEHSTDDPRAFAALFERRLCHHLNDVSENLRRYVDTFLPLLALELRQNVAQAVVVFVEQYRVACLPHSSPISLVEHDERDPKKKEKITSLWARFQFASRRTVSFDTIFIAGDHERTKSGHPLLAEFQSPKQPTMDDLVVVEVGDPEAMFKNSVCFLGRVTLVNKGQLTIEVCSQKQLNSRLVFEGTSTDAMIAACRSTELSHDGVEDFRGPAAVIHVLCSLSAPKRQLDALTKLFHSGLGQSLLTGVQNRHPMDAEQRSDPTDDNNPPITQPPVTEFNGAQRAAIHAASCNVKPPSPGSMPQFNTVIVEGPPGTGKTKTIAGSVLEVKRAGATGRVLMCAASNAAVDEVVVRLHKLQSSDTSLKIVRVGAADGVAKEVRDLGCFLDDMVEAQLEERKRNAPHQDG